MPGQWWPRRESRDYPAYWDPYGDRYGSWWGPPWDPWLEPRRVILRDERPFPQPSSAPKKGKSK